MFNIPITFQAKIEQKTKFKTGKSLVEDFVQNVFIRFK